MTQETRKSPFQPCNSHLDACSYYKQKLFVSTVWPLFEPIPSWMEWVQKEVNGNYKDYKCLFFNDLCVCTDTEQYDIIYIAVRKWKLITVRRWIRVTQHIMFEDECVRMFTEDSLNCEQKQTFLTSQHHKKYLTWACSCCTTNKECAPCQLYLCGWIMQIHNTCRSSITSSRKLNLVDQIWSNLSSRVGGFVLWLDYYTNMTEPVRRQSRHMLLLHQGYAI